MFRDILLTASISYLLLNDAIFQRSDSLTTEKENDEMNGKKIRIVILVCSALLLLLLAASAAMADGGIVNPNQARVWEFERIANSKSMNHTPYNDEGVHDDGIQAVTFTSATAPMLGGKGSWWISYNSQVYGTPISTTISLSMKDYSNNYSTVYSVDYDGFPTYVSTCTIVSGGEYEFCVWVKSTTSGNGCFMDSVIFSIADDSAHTSLVEKVASVAANCKRSTQWETALAIHDWLITNVYYDTDLHYYGADMILRGYGVCDGYAKAYFMICKKAGIKVYRVTNVNHAWNALYLDNNWYYIDCTWDDPAGAKTAISGNEGHDFFCLNTELLGLDHPKPWDWTDTTERTCTALDNNYFIRRGEWNKIGNRYNGTTYSDAISNQIAANRGGNFIPFGDFFYFSDEHDYGLYLSYPLQTGIVRSWTLLAYAMSRQPMYIPGFGSIDIDVWINESDRCFMYSIKEYAGTGAGTLILPARLTAINEETFAYTQASTVIIPEGCTRIGKNAFYGSNVHRVYIPSSVTSIDNEAFSGCSSVLILCDSDSSAMSFAMNNGFLWHYK